MAAINIAGNHNNYFKLQVPEFSNVSRTLVLPDQNSTLATVDDVFQLGSPWNFTGTTDVTGQAPLNPRGGDAYVNKVAGYPHPSWLGLDPNKSIPADALLVADERQVWHELSSSEVDPIFQAHIAYTITEADITNWNTAHGWGNHNEAGYELITNLGNMAYEDKANFATAEQGTKADEAWGWGDHGEVGYLTEELDPVFSASPAATITNQNIINWNEAWGWGDHSTEGYLKSVDKLNDIGDVEVDGVINEQVLSWDALNSKWVPRKIDVLVDGELIFQGTVDATVEGPPNTPQPGHIYVHTGKGGDDQYTNFPAHAGWSPVTEVMYGDKLAYGTDNQWHNIGSAQQGTDLHAFSAETVTPAVEGGKLVYNQDNGVFTYTQTDAYTKVAVDDKLADKANVGDSYLKSETYDQAQIDLLLDGKADAADTYTKAEVDAKFWFFHNDGVFLNKNEIDGLTITEGLNGMSAGPITVNGEVNIDAGSEWSIVGSSSGGTVQNTVFDYSASPMYQEMMHIKKQADKVKVLQEEVSELKGMIKQLIKGIK
jgi:hypothetical protein